MLCLLHIQKSVQEKVKQQQTFAEGHIKVGFKAEQIKPVVFFWTVVWWESIPQEVT